MAKELIRVPRVLGESYNSVLIERLYEAGGNVMLDLIIYLGSYHLKDLFGTSWFSVEDFCRKMGYDRTNLQRKLDSRQLAAMFGKNMQPEYVCTDTAGQRISHPIETVFEAALYKLGLENLCYPTIGEDGRTSYNFVQILKRFDKKKDTQIVASEGLFMENLETIAMSFNAQSRMNDKVTKPVGHIALSFSKEDELRLTNRIMAGIALEYMERMGIKNTQFFIAQHFDKEHPHVHIAFNRIDNNGNTISDRHERLRSTRICKELTLKYGLHMAGGKDNVKRNRLKEPDRTKYALYDIIKMEVGRCGNWNVLIANLKRQGVEVHFKHKGQTSEVQGVVFSMNGYHFNGSKVDRRFSYSKIDAALQHNRCRERMGITAGIYETATPSAPSGTAQSELFNGSWGLLKSSGSSYNAADAEANQEMVDILRRRKKVKRKRGVGF
jgi:hypothetical protein